VTEPGKFRHVLERLNSTPMCSLLPSFIK